MPHSLAAVTFASWLEERRYAPATVRVYSIYVERLLAHVEDVETATVDDLHRFWSTLPQTAASRNQARKALIALYRSHGRKDGAPAVDLPALPEPFGLPRPVDGADFALLTAAAQQLGGMHEVVGLALAYTGCRISELRTARWEHFDLRSSTPVWWIIGKGAGRRGPKVRQMPLHPVLVPVLATWRLVCGSPAVLFPSTMSASGLVSDTTIRGLVYDLADTAGLDRVVPHRFRHTVGTSALAATNDLRAVQELLGHGNVTTTQKYTAVLPGRLRALVETL